MKVWSYVLEALLPIVVGGLVARLLQHCFVIYGRRDGGECRFAVQNGEDVPFDHWLHVSVGFGTTEGTFLETPQLIAGPLEVGARVESSEKGLVAIVPRLRALGTLFVVGRTDGRESYLTLTLRGWDPKEGRPSKVSPFLKELTLTVQEGSAAAVVGAGFPGWMIWCLSIVASCSVFAIPILGEHTWLGTVGTWRSYDAIILGALIALSLLVFRLCRRRPAPVIQGRIDGGTDFLVYGRNTWETL
jgi:hypothetical protein